MNNHSKFSLPRDSPIIPCNNQDNNFDDVVKCQLPLGHDGAHENTTTWGKIK